MVIQSDAGLRSVNALEGVLVNGILTSWNAMSCLAARIDLIVFFQVCLLHGTSSIKVFIGGRACFSINEDHCVTMLPVIGLARRLDSMIFGKEVGGRLMIENMKLSCLASICASIVSVPIR